MKKTPSSELVRYSKLLHGEGLVSSTDGNVSVRTAEGFLITPSGFPKRELKGKFLVALDKRGNPVSGKASSELSMHLEIYRKRPDVAAVVHAHPPFATALALARVSLEECPLSELRITLGAVGMVPYKEPGSADLSRAAAKALGRHGRALVLENHGALTVGGSLESAYYRMEALEHACRIFLHALLLGKPRPFTAKVKKKLDDIGRRYGLA